MATPVSSIVRPADGGKFTAHRHSSPDGDMPYQLFTPLEYDAAKRYPLILWLHGASGRGKDNESQIAGDQAPGTQTWTTAEQQAAYPAFVLVPQTETDWDKRDADPKLTPALTLVLQILDAVSAAYSIDPLRTYVLGQSLGGSGVWRLVTQHPGKFAAAVLVCPVIYHPERAAKAASVPMWIFIGDQDGLVGSVRNAVEALRKAGGTPGYTEYKGAGHDIWTRVFKEPELVRWLFAQTK